MPTNRVLIHKVPLLFQVAAQNCRKRKIDQISQLSQQVQETRWRKQQLLSVRDDLFRQQEEWSTKLSLIQDEVLLALKKDSKDWALDLEAHDISLVRKESSEEQEDV